ncbi:MAG: HAD family hydrolase [Myxococcota bacterium]
MKKSIDLSQVQVVSWDIDGTLYDLHILMSHFKKDLLRRMFSFGWIAAWRDFFRLLRFKRFMDKIRANAGNYDVPTVPNRQAIEETQNEMYGRILPSIGLLPGVIELLEWLSTQPVRQVVFSDYKATGKLNALGVRDFFDTVFAGEELGHLKPSPAVFTKLTDALNIPPEALLHIGDRPDTDGAAAPVVGFQAAIIGTDFATAHDLLAALKKD